MTLKELKEKVRVERAKGYCSYLVTIKYRGKEYTCHSNNSLAWDRLNDDNFRDNHANGFYTNKQAYMAFWIECMSKNGLGEYSIV